MVSYRSIGTLFLKMDFSISGISGKVYNFSIPAREMGTFSILFTKAYQYRLQHTVKCIVIRGNNKIEE
jgi:hypothetical protein